MENVSLRLMIVTWHPKHALTAPLLLDDIFQLWEWRRGPSTRGKIRYILWLWREEAENTFFLLLLSTTPLVVVVVIGARIGAATQRVLETPVSHLALRDCGLRLLVQRTLLWGREKRNARAAQEGIGRVGEIWRYTLGAGAPITYSPPLQHGATTTTTIREKARESFFSLSFLSYMAHNTRRRWGPLLFFSLL